MKIATWNVNSVRSRLEHLEKYLGYAAPDVLCLQETKVEDALFPREIFEKAGFRCLVLGQKSYNGVAILTKPEPSGILEGLSHLAPDHPLNAQKRLLSAVVGGVRVASLYMPNGEEVGSDKYSMKLAFMAELRIWAEEVLKKGPLLILGDYNVAPAPEDLYNPEERGESILCSAPEREGFGALLNLGLADLFRRSHPEPGRYSWWDYRDGSYWKGHGMRLDHALGDAVVAARLVDCDIDERPRKWMKPSDHTPLWVQLLD